MTTIGPGTKVNIASAAAVISVLMGGYIWLDRQFDSLRNDIRGVGYEVSDLRDRAWYVSDMRRLLAYWSKSHPEFTSSAVDDIVELRTKNNGALR